MLNYSLSTVAAVCFLVGVAGIVLWPLTSTGKKRRLIVDDDILRELELADEDDFIYLDFNGTTPVYPEVLQSMIPYLTVHYGNPSSIHKLARKPREAIDTARSRLLDLLEAPATAEPSAIWFTACGTESDNLAIHLALQSTAHLFQGTTLPHFVASNVEHFAITNCLDVLVAEGRCEVTYVTVNKEGRVSADDMISAIRPNTVLVTLMLANNESGALQPVKPVSLYCRQQNVLFHTDAAQAAGKVSVALKDLGDADMISLVGHKIGAPKGVACLYVRPGCLTEGERHMHNHGVLLLGGGQEFGRRGGTENVAFIVGFGCAAVNARLWKEKGKRMALLRSRLLNKLQEELCPGNVRANGPENPALRLPNTLSVGLKGVHSGDLLQAVADQVGASAGATCHSAGGISSVLRAMQVPEEFARGTLRLSVGASSTFEQMDRAARIIAEQAKAQLARPYQQ